MSINYRAELLKEFPENELEWRVKQCGVSNGKSWVMALVYVKARAIQNRLDEVFGWENWSEEYREVSGNIICRLGVCIDGRWIYKENGSSQTDIEAFKGGISGAFKRVASSGYGIGRYLYYIEKKFVECSLEKKHGYTEQAKYKDKKTNKTTNIYWKIPKINNNNELKVKNENKPLIDNEPVFDPYVISVKQARRIFVLANNNESIVRTVLDKYGYKSSRLVKKNDYDRICYEVEKEVSNKVKEAV